MMADRFRDRQIERKEISQTEGFQGMPDHGGRGHDTETHLIGVQDMVPRKEVTHSAKINAGHLGKI